MEIKGKKVFVTGSDGFIGSHLVERLVKEGAEVYAFCFYNSNGLAGWLEESPLKDKAKIILGDIRDGKLLEKLLKDMEIVFHLAALISIPYSYIAPESFIDTNIKGTLNILEAGLKNGCKRIIHTSTSEVYGTPSKIPIRETHPLIGQSPYSASKIAADKICEAYFYSYNLPVVILRPFNTYGPRQSMRAIIPTIIFQLLSGKKEVELGNLKPKRDLTYIDDTIDGFIKAAKTENIEGETIQLGTGKTYSVLEIFEIGCRVLKKKAKIKQVEERLRPEKSDVMVLQSDPEKAKKILNWKPKFELEEGIEKTAKWMENKGKKFFKTFYHV